MTVWTMMFNEEENRMYLHCNILWFRKSDEAN